MKLIEGLTDDAVQLHHVLLEDKSTADMTLTYLPAIQRWQLDINHPSLIAGGMLLTLNPNQLRQYRKTAGFGITCVSADNVDPFLIDDFSSGRVELYLLEGSDIAYMENTIIGQQ